ncbi:serine/threonine protein kinase [Corallococcus macrosporus]|uniref:non-specific serine/threonine protein kinase n=1 Tax=Myxococcus fulvus (strain ATCC BAA-855 / HW-1) TaxID=483219 RepID=F8CI54_MYXFH|nr:serine/threonine-protein kinase [Corallococcus macrosporus]AEI62611.1 protein kinase [Corallococcus macrosporus]
MSHPALLQPGQVVDGWRVVRMLGAGTYGAVYQVEKDGRHFAMKLAMHRASSGDAEQADARLKRELGCLVHLEHANIIASRAHGRWPDLVTGWLYVVLDLVEGYTLAEWVERTHPTAREVVRVFGKLAGAVDYMHGRGVFHRDLKLGNIMVRAADGEPFILDFSAGDYTNAEDLTDAPLPPGTRRYRSPEAARFLRENGDDRDARYAFKVTDDVYALGVCLFDVLTAPEPTSGAFKAPVEGRLMPPPAREVNPRVPQALSDTAMCFIARRPEQRPPTAEVMRRMLESFAGEGGPEWTLPLHPPVTTPRLDPATGSDAVPAPRQSRRVRASVVGGVLLLMGLLGALAYSGSRWASPSSVPAGDGSLPPVVMADAGAVARLAVAPLPSLPREDGGAPPLPPARSPAGVALPPQAPVQKESPAVKRAPSVANSSAPPAKKVVSSRARGAEFLAKCAAASAAVALQLGCPGSVQMRPSSGACPADAQQAMRARGLRTMASVMVEIDVSRKPDATSLSLRTYGDGPVRSRVNGPTRGMPEGTMLYGQVWTGDGRFFARYTQAEYPDGTIIPVCFVIGPDGSEEGYEGSKPGAVVFQFFHPAYIVYSRWP